MISSKLIGPWRLGPDQIALACLLVALAGAGIATAFVIPWLMVSDNIEYDQLKTGQRREGSYYAFAPFFQKLATGAAIWVMGQASALTGYIDKREIASSRTALLAMSAPGLHPGFMCVLTPEPTYHTILLTVANKAAAAVPNRAMEGGRYVGTCGFAG